MYEHQLYDNRTLPVLSQALLDQLCVIKCSNSDSMEAQIQVIQDCHKKCHL